MRWNLISLINIVAQRQFLLFAILIFGIGLPLELLAQDEDSTPQRGLTPTGSYLTGEIETISTQNGNLMLNIPLVTMPKGRGGSFGSTMRLVYNSKIWDTHHESGMNDQGTQEVDKTILGASDEGGWRYGFKYGLHLFDRRDLYNVAAPQPICPDPAAYYVWKLYVIFPDGSHHEFRPTGFPLAAGYSYIRPDGWATDCSTGVEQPSVSGPMTYFNVDGTYAKLEFAHDSDSNWWNNSWTLYLADGGRVSCNPATSGAQTIMDRNGNSITIQDITLSTGHLASQVADPLGRLMLIEHYSSNVDWIYLLENSSSTTPLNKWTVNWRTIVVNKTYISGASAHDVVSESFYVADQILLPSELPGNLRYAFDYNAGTANPSYGWGEVSSIILPPGTSSNGAQVTYAYNYDNSNNNFASSLILKNRPIQKNESCRLEYDGTTQSNTETWTYGSTLNSLLVTGPDGGILEEFYEQSAPPLSWNHKQLFKTSQSNGRVVERLWLPNTPYGEYDANPYVKTEFTSIRNSSGTLTKTAIKDYNYDKNGNMSRLAEYDWVDYGTVPRDGNGRPTGVPASAPLKRVVTNTYNNATPDATNTTTDSANAYHKSTCPYLRNAIATQETASDTQTLSRAEFTYDNASTTGNLTQLRSWDSAQGSLIRPLSSGNSITVQHQYDGYGNRTYTTDARGYQTHWTYGVINGFSGLYPTQVEVAINDPSMKRTSTMGYNFARGWLIRNTDVDNNVATSTSYDVLGRPTLVRAAEGKSEETQTATTYNDLKRRVIVRPDLNTVGDGSLISIGHFDELGRVRLSRQIEDGNLPSDTDETTGIKVQTRYRQSAGYRYTLVSNPYRAAYSNGAGSETTMGWILSQTQLDSSGNRVLLLQTISYSGAALPAPWDSNSTTTGTVTAVPDGFYTTVTDQASKVRRSKVDGLGRLIEVTEDPSGLAYVTTYTYDALSNLTQVTQGSQPRTFNYSSLSRLTSATNPESGTMSYQYDGNGNLTQRTDARGTVTAYVYDPLNRLTNRNYTVAGSTTATANVTYTYDGTGTNFKGRLRSVGTGDSTTNFTQYDALGRVLASSQATPSSGGQTYTFGYTYNRAGALKTETFPSGRIVTSGYDPAGRLNGVTGQKSGESNKTYTTSFTYSPQGAVGVMKLGNLWEHSNFNSRLQPTQIGLGTSSTDSSKLRLDYGYGTTNNNGNALSQGITIGTTSFSQSYEYDALNRLLSAREGSNWSQTYAYDRYGNRAVTAGSSYETGSAMIPVALTEFNTASNRFTSPSVYDSAGNLTNDKVARTMAYDAENRQTQFNAGLGISSYAYDGDGRRVRKVYNGETTVFVYDALGRLAAEYKNSAVSGAGGTTYIAQDHLGSNRVTTDSTGNIKSRHDYFPFGGEIISTIGSRSSITGYSVTDPLRFRYTSKERDTESGLDYFLARYHSAAQGRFTSVDPAFLFKADLDMPQKWNRYVYVLNNPFFYVDPDGRRTIIYGGTFNGGASWGQPGTAFNAAVSRTFCEQAKVMMWSGDNNIYARKRAALELAIETATVGSGELLNIVSHSHSKNIVYEYTQLPGVHKIDNLITLGGPEVNYHMLNPEKVGNYFNVYSVWDSVQSLLGGLEILTFAQKHLTFAGRTNQSAINIDATLYREGNDWRLAGHSDLHNVSIWNQFLEMRILEKNLRLREVVTVTLYNESRNNLK